MSDCRIVLTTTDSRDAAAKLAHALVEQRLAACVNIVGPIESVYRWKEKVETAGEFLLLIKTTAARFAAVRDAIQQLHSYELPECISIAIDEGSAEYLQWLRDNAAPGAGER
jgi:periplasmic divalent cation tolerance protein